MLGREGFCWALLHRWPTAGAWVPDKCEWHTHSCGQLPAFGHRWKLRKGGTFAHSIRHGRRWPSQKLAKTSRCAGMLHRDIVRVLWNCFWSIWFTWAPHLRKVTVREFWTLRTGWYSGVSGHAGCGSESSSTSALTSGSAAGSAVRHRCLASMRKFCVITAFFFRIWHMVVLCKSPLGFLLREFPDGITWREWFADIIWYNVLSEVPMLKWLEGIYIENTTHISSTHCVHLLFCRMSTLDTSGDHHGRRTLAWNSNTHVLWLWN